MKFTKIYCQENLELYGMDVTYGTPIYRRISTLKFALRICAKQWDLGHDELMINFNVPSLQNHRLYDKLCTMPTLLSIFFIHTSPLYTISTWNSLPSNNTDAPSVYTFETHLASHCFVFNWVHTIIY